MMKSFYLFILLLCFILIGCSSSTILEDENPGKEKTESNTEPSLGTSVVVAYVTSWSNIIPEVAKVTHVNYAFGHVTGSFNGIRIDNDQRLRKLVALKSKKPELKVLLSIGGWESGNFSEMAASGTNRVAFAKDCKRVIDQYNLDGIDVDWEFPTSSDAGISSSPQDTEDYTLMMREIREAIGTDKLLTLASNAGAGYVNFRAFYLI